KLYQQACDLGAAAGCNNLGYMLEHGEGMKQDPRKALLFYKKACDKGSERACENAQILEEARNERGTKRP
ncbi:MAG: hypothetical protein ABI193_25400, partial [Minicystis sp.]